MNHPSHSSWKVFLLFGAAILLAAWFVFVATLQGASALTANGNVLAVTTSTPTASSLPTALPPALPTMGASNPHDTGDCFACHSRPDMTGRLKNGETISLYVDLAHYNDTVHSSCTFCHINQKTYPHEPANTQSCATCHWQLAGGQPPAGGYVFDLPFENARQVTYSISANCRRCHQDKYDTIQSNVHSATMAEGNPTLPICVDCHGLHNIQKITRELTVQICQKCHYAEYLSYRDSIHGKAFLGGNNEDVPICEDCHGSHKIVEPKDAYALCARCHSDQERMAKYGISTAVLSTYLDDFHGRSANLLNASSTELQMMTATCYDCHGVHDILAPSDPNSKVNSANLQRTCQQCHADAGSNFPQAWLSHKRPSLQEMPALYVANLVMGVLFGAAVLFFIAYIISDLARRKKGTPSAEPAQGNS